MELKGKPTQLQCTVDMTPGLGEQRQRLGSQSSGRGLAVGAGMGSGLGLCRAPCVIRTPEGQGSLCLRSWG